MDRKQFRDRISEALEETRNRQRYGLGSDTAAVCQTILGVADLLGQILFEIKYSLDELIEK